MLFWRWMHPEFLLLLPLPLAWLVWQWRSRRRRHPAVIFSDGNALRAAGTTLRVRLLPWLPVLRTLVLLLGIVALARPQYGQIERRQTALGIDIALAMDISGSMDAIDFRPTRLEAAKKVLNEFISSRNNDRISVVLFGSEAKVLAPPTFDRRAVTQLVEMISPDLFRNEERQTAIGMGLALALKTMEQSPIENRVVVLLTDGENNAGRIEPLEAATMAKALKARVYTIAVGSEGAAMSRVNDPLWGPRFVQVSGGIDEPLLREIADMTGGKFFIADDAEALSAVYRSIDELEKTEIETSAYENFDERFFLFWIPALALFGIETLLRAMWLGRIP
jgi:Ca-activated chloride channel family protein